MDDYGQACSSSQSEGGLGQRFSWEECYATAQQVPLPDLGLVCSPLVDKLVTGYSRGIGCPEDYILLPLLSACAALMGTKTKIQVNQTWREPTVLWTVVGAKPGTRKTAAFKQVITPLIETEREQRRTWSRSRQIISGSGGTSSPAPPRILAGAMPMSELTNVLLKNSGQILCAVENIEHFHKCMDLNGEQTQNILHDLYDGLPLFDVKNGDITSLETVCFNHSGFASPEYITELHWNSPSWISSKYLVSCAPDPNFSTIWQTNPISQDTPSLKSIFLTLLAYHQQPRTYTFSEDALKELMRCHDEEWTSMVSQLDQDEKRRAIIEKSLGQIVRVAGVMKALVNACEYRKQSTETPNLVWDLNIDRNTVCKAIELNKYFVDQKLSLMLVNGFGFGMSVYSGAGHMSREALRRHQQIQQERRVQQQRQLSHDGQQGSRAFHESSNGGADDTIETDDGNEDIQRTAPFVQMDNDRFILVHKKRIRRLLECFDDGNGVTATTASQKSITPPVKIAGSNNRHPVWASALFFQKCQEIDIGTAVRVKNQCNRKFYWRFKRKPVNELTDGNKQLLEHLRIDMRLYSRIGPRFDLTAPMSPRVTPTMFFMGGASFESHAAEPSSDYTNERTDMEDSLDNDNTSSITTEDNFTIIKAEPE